MYMKKIIIFTALILFIPFVIVNFFDVDKKEETTQTQTPQINRIGFEN